MILKGKVWKFGDDITTDHIAPGRYYHLRNNLGELVKHVMEDIRENFHSLIEKGDIIVAGKNFGMGSSREHAPRIIKLAGISCVVAKSFARIFYRNSMNIGLPLITFDQVDSIDEGDLLRIDLEEGMLEDLTKGVKYRFEPIPKFVLKTIKEGGIVNYIRKHGDLPPEV